MGLLLAIWMGISYVGSQTLAVTPDGKRAAVFPNQEVEATGFLKQLYKR